MTGNALFLTITSALVVVPGLLWYLTADPVWALGWILIIILGAAG